MNTGLSVAEKSALSVSYEVLGTKVDLDLDFVKRYLVRGRADLTTDQELVFFMNTCKMQRLNPLASGEVYLIKYNKDQPAQLVVGKDAYLRRAYGNPNYLQKSDGIVVQRNKEIIKKEGCCLYPNEVLIGGWCKVTFIKQGQERTAYKEVALAEYNSGMANWKSKPATMINKVAVSQCVRDAFPNDYEGVYSEEELVASGTIPVELVDGEQNQAEAVVVDNDPLITNEQRQEMFRTAKKYLGDTANDVVKTIIGNLGFSSTANLRVSDYVKAMEALQEAIDNSFEQDSEEAEE